MSQTGDSTTIKGDSTVEENNGGNCEGDGKKFS